MNLCMSEGWGGVRIKVWAFLQSSMTKFFKESFTCISVFSGLIVRAAGLRKRISWPKK
jgi:hypothetical protein